MISIAKFGASVNDVERLFQLAKFSPERYYFPRYQALAATLRNLNYVEQWKSCYRTRIYDIKLFDSSLLQFQYDTLSYSFLEAPFDIPSFEAFAEDYGVDSHDDSVELRGEYDLYMSSLEPRPATPIRFDYSPSTYKEGLHPTAHIHAGFGSNIRFATERVLTPVSFALLIIRQCYPDHWHKLQGSTIVTSRLGEIRTNLPMVGSAHRRARDREELYFV